MEDGIPREEVGETAPGAGLLEPLPIKGKSTESLINHVMELELSPKDSGKALRRKHHDLLYFSKRSSYQ